MNVIARLENTQFEHLLVSAKVHLQQNWDLIFTKNMEGDAWENFNRVCLSQNPTVNAMCK